MLILWNSSIPKNSFLRATPPQGRLNRTLVQGPVEVGIYRRFTFLTTRIIGVPVTCTIHAPAIGSSSWDSTSGSTALTLINRLSVTFQNIFEPLLKLLVSSTSSSPNIFPQFPLFDQSKKADNTKYFKGDSFPFSRTERVGTFEIRRKMSGKNTTRPIFEGGTVPVLLDRDGRSRRSKSSILDVSR